MIGLSDSMAGGCSISDQVGDRDCALKTNFWQVKLIVFFSCKASLEPSSRSMLLLT